MDKHGSVKRFLQSYVKNQKLQIERDISFDQISEIILRKEYIDILENPSRANKQIFVIQLKNYTYAVPFIFDDF